MGLQLGDGQPLRYAEDVLCTAAFITAHHLNPSPHILSLKRHSHKLLCATADDLAAPCHCCVTVASRVTWVVWPKRLPLKCNEYILSILCRITKVSSRVLLATLMLCTIIDLPVGCIFGLQLATDFL